ncbi:unnamed protein product, partial [Chrysoparadoxa australica]
AKPPTQLKEQLLTTIAPLEKGRKASEEDAAQVEGIVKKLENANPTKSPLKSPLINARWELLYTTSQSINGKSSPAIIRSIGPIYQYIDTNNLTARNEEFFSPLRITRAVDAELSPVSSSFTNVQFKEFQIGPFKFPAPESAKGALDTTYLDKNMRISRGDKGNLFV